MALWNQYYPQTTEPEGGPNLGDYGRAAWSGTVSLGAGAAALAGSASRNFDNPLANLVTAGSEYLRGSMNQNAEDIQSDMSPAALAAITAPLGSEEWWRAPFSSTMLKLTNSAPSVAASIGATVFSGGNPAVGTALLAATAGGISAGSTLDEIYEGVRSQSDAELQASSQPYAALRATMDEQRARQELEKMMTGYRPLMLFALGAATGAIGPAGQISRTLRGVGNTAGRGVVARTGLGATQGAGAEAVQSGAETYTSQMGRVAAGFQTNVDWSTVGLGAAEGGILGGIMGGGADMLAGRASGATPPPAAPRTPPVTSGGNTTTVVAPGGAPSPAAAAALTATQPTPVPPPAAPGAPQGGAPTPPVTPPTPASPAAVQPPPAFQQPMPPSPTVPVNAPVQQGAQPVAPPAQTAPGMTPTAAPIAGAPVAPRPPKLQEVMQRTAGVTPVQAQQAAVAPPLVADTATQVPTPVETPVPIEAPLQGNTQRKIEKASKELLEAKVLPDGRRILEDITPEALAAKEEYAQQDKEIAEKLGPIGEVKKDERVGQHASKGKVAEVKAKNQTADDIVKTFLPGEGEGNYASPAAPAAAQSRAAIMQRVRNIVEAANKSNINDKVFKDVANKEIAANPARLLITEARGLLRLKNPKLEDYNRFITRELELRGGLDEDFEAVKAQRREEGDIKKRAKGTTGADNIAAKEPDAAAFEVEETGDAPVSDTGDAKEDISPSADKDAVETKVAKSAKLSRASESESTPEKPKANAPKVTPGKEVSPEEKARLIALLSKASKKESPETKPLPPKVATAKAKIETAAKETDKTPTPAQKKAGNYRKGTATFEGMSFSIENPKGSIRKGVGADGKPWQVKMPAHYGYIKRTEGADGDQIDAYFGPSLGKSDLVFVLDQKDPATGKFDEHKVFIGFDNAVQVQETYRDSFSDGSADTRFESMATYDMEGFKAWLKEGDTKAPISTDADMIEGLNPALRRPQYINGEPTGLFSIYSNPLTKPKKGPYSKQNRNPRGSLVGQRRTQKELEEKAKDWDWVRPIITLTGREVLDKIDLKLVARSNVATQVLNFIRAKVRALVPDIKVHIVSEDTLAKMIGEYSEGMPLNTAGFYIGRKHVVYILEDVYNNDAEFAQIALHELVHAATVKAIQGNDQFQKDIRALAEQAWDQLLVMYSGQKMPFDYAFTDAYEFVAEAFSKPELQDALAKIKISDELSIALGLKRLTPIRLWDVFIMKIRQALGLPDNTFTALDGILRVTDRVMDEQNSILARERPQIIPAEFDVDMEDTVELNRAPRWAAGVQAKIDSIVHPPEMQDQLGRPRFLGIQTFDQIARLADRFFGKNNPVRKVQVLTERIRVQGEQLLAQSEPIVRRIREMETKYQGAQWAEFADLIHTETRFNVFADRALATQTHLGKNALKGVQGKAHWAALNARWNALPADLKALRLDGMQHFTTEQNKMARGLLHNRLASLGYNDAALEQRIFDDTQTAADEALMGPHLDMVQKVMELAKIAGPYFPLMRRGEYLVAGIYNVTPPSNGALVPGTENVYEFKGATGRANAEAFSGGLHLNAPVHSVWVDATTGETHVTDPATGKLVKVHKNDTNAEQRFRVNVQDSHLEFFETDKEAKEAAAELEANGQMKVVHGVQRKRPDLTSPNDLLSLHLERMAGRMKHHAGFQDMTPAMQHELRSAIDEAAIQFMGSTRIQSKRLPRRGVKGYSHDLTKNALEYARSTSGYIAKLNHQQDMDKALKEMEQLATGNPAGYAKNTSLGRSEISAEITRRVMTYSGTERQTPFSPWVSRLLSISFIDKLASVSYSVINATQVAMVTFPTLSAKYGVGKTFRALAKAYADIGAHDVARKGVVDTAKKVRAQDAQVSDPLADILARLRNPMEARMIRELVDTGSIDPSAGFEIGRIIDQTKWFDKKLGYLEGIARQLPRSVEAINRTASALAAFRLEYARSSDYDGAVQYARDAVDSTQFNYSATNAAPIFNHPLARIALQFKKFGQGMYHLIGTNIGKAIRNESPGDRIEAIKALAYLSAMHSLVAGILGLPTEPFKIALMAANVVGLTGMSWEDVEAAEREALAGMFGRDIGEVIARGVPRAFGVDVSSRLGLDSLMTFGEPRSDDGQDVKAYLWDLFGGAPGSLLMNDWVPGMNALMDGDFDKAAEKLIPIKAATDLIKSYRTMTEGKISAAGDQTMTPYNLGEAITQGLGFTPAREAESREAQAQFYNKQGDYRDTRTSLMDAWVAAEPHEKSWAWAQIQQFNRSQERAQRITMSNLQDARKRQRRERRVHGIVTNPTNDAILQGIESVYGI